MNIDINQKFLKFESANENIIEKYMDLLPIELINVWKDNGFGTLLNGYIKIINPLEYQDILNISYYRAEISIPIMITAFGDIITWEQNRYLRLVKYKNGTVKGISAGFDFFWEDFFTDEFQQEFFDIEKYNDALKIHGNLKFDECYGYVPLLGLGGSESTSNIMKVKIKEHLELITQLIGRIE